RLARHAGRVSVAQRKWRGAGDDALGRRGMARQSVWKSARPDRRPRGVSVRESEVQPAAVWIWGWRRGGQVQGVSIYRRGTQQTGWGLAVPGGIPGFQRDEPAGRLFSREHADSAAGL